MKDEKKKQKKHRGVRRGKLILGKNEGCKKNKKNIEE
jgi:hypothetical protein